MGIHAPSESGENAFHPDVFPDLLPIYYERLFPFGLYYKWLKYNDEKNTTFTNREFSFTLKDDVYIRFQSFKDDMEMKKEIVARYPYKIDIGAVYSHRPREQRMVSSFHPVEKELVFDIDMTDYDEVRTCCSGADICRKCWPLMTVAMKIIDRALREDFGFKHLLWVYSGRRGIHCWICDEKARKLSPTARAAIVEYLTVIKGGESAAKKVYLPEVLHPSIVKASEIIKAHFSDLMLNKQGILDTQEWIEKIALLCRDSTVAELIKSSLPKLTSSQERWQELENVVAVALDTKSSKQKQTNKNRHFLLEVMFQLCYPRLDANVSKGLNHLLKAPFCVHPKTGRICVPIDMRKINSFDPMSVPTISQVCEEINTFDARTKSELHSDDSGKASGEKIPDAYKTSLKKSIEIFQGFVEKVLNEP